MMAALMALVCSSYDDSELCQKKSKGEKFAKHQSETFVIENLERFRLK